MLDCDGLSIAIALLVSSTSLGSHERGLQSSLVRDDQCTSLVKFRILFYDCRSWENHGKSLRHLMAV